MAQSETANMYRGLPLTADQEREIRHYIHTRQRAGQDWDTPELKAMVEDMLDPPEAVDEDPAALASSCTAETAAATRQLAQDQLQDGEPRPDAADHLA